MKIIRFSFLLVFAYAVVHSYAQKAKVDSLKTLLGESGTDTARVKILTQLTWSLYTIGENDEARKVAEEIVSMSGQTKYSEQRFWIKRKAYGLGILGILDTSQGKYQQAKRYHLEALQLRKEIADTGDIGGSLLNLGVISYYLGEYPEAIQYYLESLKIAEVEKDTDGIAIIYNNIGGVHEYLDEYDEALAFYKRSLKLREMLKDQRGIASAYNNIGNIYDYQKKYVESIVHHQNALQICTALDDARGMAIANDNIANTYSHLGQYLEEMKYRETALALYNSTGDQLGILGCIMSNAESYYKQKKYTDAIASFQKGLALAEELGTKDRVQDAYAGLAATYAGLHQYEKAYTYDTLYMSIRDKLLNEHKQSEITNMKEKYESEKKDAEIVLLNKNAELTAETHKRKALIRNILIAAGLILILLLFARYRFVHALQVEKIRNRISQDLHDDIGSTLSSISIASTAASLMKPDRTSDIYDTLQLIGLNARKAMENMSDIVWAINPAHDTFKDMMDRLKIFGYNILDARQIKLSFDIPDSLNTIRLSIEQRKNIYLILREAIHNVAKYSYAQECTVYAQQSHQRVMLSVRDDGKGFESTSASLGGNGLLNMKHRAEELKASFDIRSEINKGTSISLQFAHA